MDSESNDPVTRGARDMAESADVSDTLARLLEMCVEAVDACDFAGVSLVEQERVRTLAASDEILRQMDDLQFRLREGPCFDAMRQHDVVSAVDLSSDARWPNWGPLVSGQTGVHSSLSYRLFTSHRALGALNLYAKAPSAFTHDDVLEGHVVATHAAVAVAGTLKEVQLTRALQTRTVIGQATGILMERYGLDAESAFATMRRVSQAHNVKLHTLADELVRTGRIRGLDVGEPIPTDGDGGATRA